MASVTLPPPVNFYPRPLRGGRRLLDVVADVLRHISIHALCEEGDADTAVAGMGGRISIHALCEEGDRIPGLPDTGIRISIHALCEEGDLLAV